MVVTFNVKERKHTLNSILVSCGFSGVVPKKSRQSNLCVCAFNILLEKSNNNSLSLYCPFEYLLDSWIVKSVAIDTVAGGFHWVWDLSSIFDLFIGYFLLYYTMWICSVMSVWHFIFGWGSVFHIVVIPSSHFHSGLKKTSRIVVG